MCLAEEQGGTARVEFSSRLSLRTVTEMRLLSSACGEIRRRGLGSAMVHLLVVLAVSLPCLSCPDRCVCSSQTVKCQKQDLDSIPHSIPSNTKILFVTGNNISSISADSFPSPLEQLTDLYLSGNEIQSVDSEVFDNLPNLVRLDLSNNNIQEFSERAFPHSNSLQVLNLSRSFHNYSQTNSVLNNLLSGNLAHLTVLDLSDNDLLVPPDNMSANLPSLLTLNLQNASIVSLQNGTLTLPLLRDLHLQDNRLKNLPSAILSDFSLAPGLHIHLSGNPWRCDCFIEDMVAWLKNSTQVVDAQNLTCAYPGVLRRQALLHLQQTRLKCAGNMEGVLETSYVFLGLVLALIGVIFLLVLYLNRKGIKRWMYNIRDACRDHMEGYHYRYEINSDPRLANLSINSDV